MLPTFRTFWQKAKKPLEIAVVSIFVVGFIVLIILVILGTIFKWNWTGFGAETTDPKQHAKTLWDWLQLLIIPVVLAIGGYAFNLTTSRNEQQSTQLRDQTEREIASDNQQESALQAYIDKMSELLLEKDLRGSTEASEVRKIARVRTLTVLPRLDAERKGSIVQFLYEAGLLNKSNAILDLEGANLREANLSRTTFIDIRLCDTNLSGANLTEALWLDANLTSANFTGADLTEASCSRSDLSGAKLTGANLTGASFRDVSFSETDLSKANLTRANLTGARFRIANLNEADLSGANLADVKMDQSSLDKANVTKEQLAMITITAP